MNTELSTLFDEESSERPHLDILLAQDRAATAALREELDQASKCEDEWRELHRRLWPKPKPKN